MGLTCDVGLVERTERLILVLVGTGFLGIGIPYALQVCLWVLLVGSTVTWGSASSRCTGSRRAHAAVSGLRDRLVDAGYAAGWGAVKALPEPVARTAFDRAGPGRPAATARAPGSCGPTCGWSRAWTGTGSTP